MSSFPARYMESWRSSAADELSPIRGAFSFDVALTGMVPQTLQFLLECSLSDSSCGQIGQGFLDGMRFSSSNPPTSLLFWKDFKDASDLFSYQIDSLSEAIRQLELHVDINFVFSKVTYLASGGTGLDMPLWVIVRRSFNRGVGFEIDERGAVRSSLNAGDFALSDRVRVAQQHYSTGMALMATEDTMAGLIDAAFMQFCLAVEAVLGEHERQRALETGKARYPVDFDQNMSTIVSHVFIARHRFFGHAHPKFLKGLLDVGVAFDIAKQALVARWCARRLIELELGRPLVKREMRSYPRIGSSVEFRGDASALSEEFALPT